MAAESLVANAWALRGFLTKRICPVRIASSGQGFDRVSPMTKIPYYKKRRRVRWFLASSAHCGRAP